MPGSYQPGGPCTNYWIDEDEFRQWITRRQEGRPEAAETKRARKNLKKRRRSDGIPPEELW